MERDLLIRYKSAHEAVAAAEEGVKSARAEERSAEQALIDYLEAHQASATGKYDGLGWCQIQKPRLFASVMQEAVPVVFAWLREHGHGAAIKEQIHPSSLSQIVGEALHDGVELPKEITYYLKPQLRLYGGNDHVDR